MVPALHRNRAEIRRIFLDHMPDAPADLTDDPHALAEAARLHLRRLFLQTKVAISGANFAIAETGGLLVAESEGNGRMCLTLPETLISVVGIEKLIPTFRDLEVFLQLLPRSSTGERMNPYNSIWTGVTPGDGPQEVHIVLLDNGRTNALQRPRRPTGAADASGAPPASTSARCTSAPAATPTARPTRARSARSSPRFWSASSTRPSCRSPPRLCGACYEVCPVEIDIPTVLVKLRHDAVKAKRHKAQDAAFAAAAHRDERPPALDRGAQVSQAHALRPPRRAPTAVQMDPHPRPPRPPSRAVPRLVEKAPEGMTPATRS